MVFNLNERNNVNQSKSPETITQLIESLEERHAEELYEIYLNNTPTPADALSAYVEEHALYADRLYPKYFAYALEYYYTINT